MQGNEELWGLITLLPNQWEVGGHGAYALKVGAFIETARCLGIRTNRAFFGKLRLYEETVLQIINEKKSARESDDEYRESIQRAQRKRAIWYRS